MVDAAEVATLLALVTAAGATTLLGLAVDAAGVAAVGGLAGAVTGGAAVAANAAEMGVEFVGWATLWGAGMPTFAAPEELLATVVFEAGMIVATDAGVFAEGEETGMAAAAAAVGSSTALTTVPAAAAFAGAAVAAAVLPWLYVLRGEQPQE